MSTPLKPATTIEEQINRLTKRGMQINKGQAEQWFTNVNYYRLSAYWYPARQFDSTGESRIDNFKPNTYFNDVVNLYEADRKLRTLIHDGMERIEIAMRTQVTELLCARNRENPAFYLDSSEFRPSFEHASWLHTVYGRLSRSSKNEAVKHNASEYGGKYPLWVVAEVLDFSDISRLFAGLVSRDQRIVAERLEPKIDYTTLNRNQKDKLAKRHPLASWLEQLTVVRNTCAHHGRLWNKSFVPASTELLRGNGNLSLLPPNQSERIFGSIQLMAHILRVVSPGTTWPQKVANILNDSFLNNPLTSQGSLGIPEVWDATTI